MPEPKIIEGTARRRPPLSKPLAWVFVAIGLGMLWWVYSTRDTVSTENLFIVAAMVAFFVGGLVSAIFRDVD